MGDDEEDDIYKYGQEAMQSLMKMHIKINADPSDYYFPDAVSEEKLLRDKYPTLQDAWEKYQAILKLVTTEEETK